MNHKEKIIEILDSKISNYLNETALDLKNKFGIKSTAKSINSMIISRIIELNELSIETTMFLKKHAVFKTATVNQKNKLVESMSFPSIDYYDMQKNDWINSSVYKYFSTKVIVIFVFKKEETDSRLIDVVYLELSDFEINEIFLIWEKVKNMVNNDTLIIGGKSGFSVENFPRKEENQVTHIRPHDQNSSEGRVLLPNGKRIINYCFWLNNNFLETKLIREGKLN